jgi:hypothetical protein
MSRIDVASLLEHARLEGVHGGFDESGMIEAPGSHRISTVRRGSTCLRARASC